MLSFTLMNLNKQNNLYANDMRPVYKALPSRPRWERLKYPTSYVLDDGNFQVSCKHKFAEDGDTVYFAFCYPQSYTECQAIMRRWDAIYAGHNAGPDGLGAHPLALTREPAYFADGMAAPNEAALAISHATASHAGSGGAGGADLTVASSGLDDRAARLTESDIYYHRELVTRSLDGRRIDLITLSSREGLMDEREPYLEGLFPDGRATPRAHRFKDKRVIFISCRVHPGETPGQFVYDGLTEFLMRSDDPRARRCRSMFVFKLVPMLNPDGVARGHYRADQLGVNLNRCYKTPKPDIEPTIFAAVCVVKHHSARGNLWLYLDLHAHATKRGCFLYGNHLPDLHDQVTNLQFARMVTLNTPYLEFGACNFSEKNMSLKDRRDKGVSKEGCGRVALYRATGLIHCYTLECNYNTGRECNAIYAADGDAERRGASPPREQRATVPKYTPEHWRDVGKGCGIAFLDMFRANPWSRLSRSQWRTFEGMKQALERGLKCEQPYKDQARKEKMAARTAGGLARRGAAGPDKSAASRGARGRGFLKRSGTSGGTSGNASSRSHGRIRRIQSDRVRGTGRTSPVAAQGRPSGRSGAARLLNAPPLAEAQPPAAALETTEGTGAPVEPSAVVAGGAPLHQASSILQGGGGGVGTRIPRYSSGGGGGSYRLSRQAALGASKVGAEIDATLGAGRRTRPAQPAPPVPAYVQIDPRHRSPADASGAVAGFGIHSISPAAAYAAGGAPSGSGVLSAAGGVSIARGSSRIPTYLPGGGKARRARPSSGGRSRGHLRASGQRSVKQLLPTGGHVPAATPASPPGHVPAGPPQPPASRSPLHGKQRSPGDTALAAE